jgi:hypothetical protein
VKIKKKNKHQPITFSEIRSGEVFLGMCLSGFYSDEVFIKLEHAVDDNHIMANACELNTGRMAKFESSDEIEPLPDAILEY